MTEGDREQIITLLVVWTGYKESVFTKLTDAELMVAYHRELNRT